MAIQVFLASGYDHDTHVPQPDVAKIGNQGALRALNLAIKFCACFREHKKNINQPFFGHQRRRPVFILVYLRRKMKPNLEPR